MKKINVFLLSILGLVVLIGAVWAYRYYTAPVRGKIEMREKVESGQHRLQAYEKFHDMYEQILSYSEQIRYQEELLEEVTDEGETSRVRRNIAGLKSQRSRLIREYNSEAKMTESRGKFRDENLPYSLDVNDFE